MWTPPINKSGELNSGGPLVNSVLWDPDPKHVLQIVPDWALSAGGRARLGRWGRGIVALHVGGEPRPARYRRQRVHREQGTNILSTQPPSATKYGN